VDDELFYQRLAKMDTAVDAGPERCNFSTDIVPLLASPQVRRYFYEKKLVDPQWLDILVAAGEFKYPPEGDSVSAWPQSDT